MYVNSIYKSIKSCFNYILKIIQGINYRIDVRNVDGSSSLLFRELGLLECSLNNMSILRHFHLIF